MAYEIRLGELTLRTFSIKWLERKNSAVQLALEKYSFCQNRKARPLSNTPFVMRSIINVTRQPDNRITLLHYYITMLLYNYMLHNQ